MISKQARNMKKKNLNNHWFRALPCPMSPPLNGNLCSGPQHKSKRLVSAWTNTAACSTCLTNVEKRTNWQMWSIAGFFISNTMGKMKKNPLA